MGSYREEVVEESTNEWVPCIVGNGLARLEQEALFLLEGLYPMRFIFMAFSASKILLSFFNHLVLLYYSLNDFSNQIIETLNLLNSNNNTNNKRKRLMEHRKMLN